MIPEDNVAAAVMAEARYMIVQISGEREGCVLEEGRRVLRDQFRGL